MIAPEKADTGAMQRCKRALLALGVGALAVSALAQGAAAPGSILPPPGALDANAPPRFLEDHCQRCHNDDDKIAGLTIEDLRGSDTGQGLRADRWEAILRKVGEGEMPPRSKPQPEAAERAAFVGWLQASLDAHAAAHPDPGRASIRRLNRVEYANAVRDLLDLPVDLHRELPQDNSGYGFDNVADVLSVSPTLMDRYLAVAGKVARLALGLGPVRPVVTAYDVPKDGSIMNGGRPAFNERESDDLPLGSRGGGAFNYFARADGQYDVTGWLNANTNNETDREPQDRVTVRVAMTAGAHVVGLSFRRQLAPDETVQTLRNDLDKVPLPLDAPVMLPMDVAIDGVRVRTVEVPSYRLSQRYSQRNFPRDVQEIDVAGPYEATGPGDTASRRRILLCRPATASAEPACAQRIIAALARRAWRQPVREADLAPLLRLYAQERATSDFEHGIAAALEAILVSPRFLFVIESDPLAAAPGLVHPVSDIDLASRLSLFLWSSIPDETLLHLAESGELHQRAVLDAQITRMLDDRRASALTDNFAGQWLYLRNLDQQRPDPAVFPDFDSHLRRAMATETSLFFGHVVAANRPITDFIDADYTFLNHRLAAHYGIPGVTGTDFRQVALDPAWHRGGLLGQASILTVTSYGNHTSVVKRGKWIMENLLAAPPPPPPADVPALRESIDGRPLTAREQLELHRQNPACAGCHVRMDPLGFALENFNGIGAWRTHDAGQTIDVGAVLPEGTHFSGLSGLRQVLMDRRDQFAQAFTERLMIYALARGVGPQDRPAIRAIARAAAVDNYRIRTIIRGIVESDGFRLRKTPDGAHLAQADPAAQRSTMKDRP
jgi:mono/diheme cytochrome c family protein